MNKSHFGTIAQMVYADKHPLNFARLVDDFYIVLKQCYGIEMTFAWDCEDIAFFDLPTTRIALAWNDRPGKGYSACMTISVGPQLQMRQLAANGYEEVCSRIVEQLNTRFPALTILWHYPEEHHNSDLIDRLVENLPPLMQLFPFNEPDWVADAMIRQSLSRVVALRMAPVEREQTVKTATRINQLTERVVEPVAEQQMTFPRRKPTVKEAVTTVHALPLHVVKPAVNLNLTLGETKNDLIPLKFSAKSASARARANAILGAAAATPVPDGTRDRPAFHHAGNYELTSIRDALYKVDFSQIPAALSTQLRLATHALNAALIFVWAPLGAAALTYSLLRGEDMKFSSRLMVLTGLFSATIQSSIVQQIGSIANV